MALHGDLVEISRHLCRSVDRLEFEPPVTHVYNPLAYARAPHESYLEFGRTGIEALLVGMNPGPFGMVQTGVPFGEIEMVRNWLGISGVVERPSREHPKRPIQGFDCLRHEVSGKRLWGWAQDRFKNPQAFFDRFFVWNYCPLAFLEVSGRNRTPDKLLPVERETLYRICDESLAKVIGTLKPVRVLGVGAFALQRVRKVLEQFPEQTRESGKDPVQTGSILHPSPASPVANRGWAPQAEKQLTELGVPLD